MENEIRNIHRKFQFQLELSMKYYQIYGARTGLHKHAHIYIHVKPSVKLNLIGIRTTFDWTYIRDHGIDFQVILLCSCRNYDLKIFMSFFSIHLLSIFSLHYDQWNEKRITKERKKKLKTMFTIIMLKGRRIILPMVSA